MSAMSADQPVTVGVLTATLAKFHREVFLPDFQRIVGDSEKRLRDEMYTLHDVVLKRLDRIIEGVRSR